MFIVDPDPKFTHPVKVRVPVDGGFVDQSFKATFRVVPIEEAATLDLRNGKQATAFLVRAIIDMADVVDANNTPVPYSDALRDQLLNLNYVRQALYDAYQDAISGARAGN